MKKILVILMTLTSTLTSVSNAQDFGPADFPGDIEKDSPMSYHDAYCRQLKRECRVRFNGSKMTVEGFKGIEREQLLGFRTEQEGGASYSRTRYFYVKYLNSRGEESTALFIFVKNEASREFGQALSRWYEQDPKPYPNYRYPASQGPQDTHGRDKGLNPYDKPPITDWSQKTTN